MDQPILRKFSAPGDRISEAYEGEFPWKMMRYTEDIDIGLGLAFLLYW
jgi:hypothetical protein